MALTSKSNQRPKRPRRLGGLLRKKQRSQIRIGFLQKLLINIFTLCDGFNALTHRRFFRDRDRPYAYASYLSRSQAKTFWEKMQVIHEAKKDKTRKIIFAKQRYGKVPARYITVCKKTPCGRLRLMAANMQ
ncbi:MAG: hypothetical protein PVG03_07715 [Desulfarculaceae bacterium]|jgi:hypothetical protein